MYQARLLYIACISVIDKYMAGIDLYRLKALFEVPLILTLVLYKSLRCITIYYLNCTNS